MSEELDVAKLFAEANTGNQEAFVRFLELQRSGRGLRYYPNGRKGADDDGVVGIAVRATGKGEERRIIVECGTTGSVLIFGRDQAITIFRAIQSQAVLPTMDPYNSDGVWLEGRVVVSMPYEANSWMMTVGEAMTFANSIRDALFQEAQQEGRAVISLLEELGELEGADD